MNPLNKFLIIATLVVITNLKAGEAAENRVERVYSEMKADCKNLEFYKDSEDKEDRKLQAACAILSRLLSLSEAERRLLGTRLDDETRRQPAGEFARCKDSLFDVVVKATDSISRR